MASCASVLREITIQISGLVRARISTCYSALHFWLTCILAPGCDFFGEGISGLQFGGTQPPPPVQQDPIDLQFAFVDVVPYLTDDESLTLQAGRFGMSFGSGRLVATRAAYEHSFFDGTDFQNSFTRVHYGKPPHSSRNRSQDTGEISGRDRTTTFWGLYVTHWFDAPHISGLVIYIAISIHNQEATYASGTAEENRQSLGTRQFGEWKGWDWNGEEVLQVGSFRKPIHSGMDGESRLRLHVPMPPSKAKTGSKGRCHQRRHQPTTAEHKEPLTRFILNRADFQRRQFAPPAKYY